MLFCPSCGQELKLKEDEEMDFFVKNVSHYIGKCKNKHQWYVEIDYADYGRAILSEVREDDDC